MPDHQRITPFNEAGSKNTIQVLGSSKVPSSLYLNGKTSKTEKNMENFWKQVEDRRREQ